MERITGYIGRRAIASINHSLDLLAFIFRICSCLKGHNGQGRVLVNRIITQQLYFTAVQALPILIPIALLVGSLVIIQFARLSGQYDFGRISMLLIVREIGPTITALLVILRSATAVTIEISYMRVLHELDTLEMSGLDPVRVVCVPRLVGITTAMVGLFVVFDLVSILGGYAIVWWGSEVHMRGFLFQIAKAITPADIGVGLTKAVLFGIIITTTCLYRGFEMKQQITEVPIATSRSAIECFLYCLVINVFISVVFYL
ncbi:MAG: ABC transporter permease [Desulfatitalea sp.]|nr:ABC transporter permease [Desulfatitalea sp.]NNJ99433.1 ABC transporter permease [Desulfatitalea sp.]